eukprot:SAG11_NODE_12611_length_694_cov_2.043697_1_plen_42_part_10
MVDSTDDFVDSPAVISGVRPVSAHTPPKSALPCNRDPSRGLG